MIAKTQRQARRNAAMMERRRAFLERWAQPKIRKAYVEMGDQFALLYEQGGDGRMKAFSDEVAEIMAGTLYDVYSRVANDLRIMAKGSTKGSVQSIEKKEESTDEELDRVYELLLESFKSEAVTQSVFITDTLWSELSKSVLEDPEILTEGPAQVAKAIRAQTKNLSTYNSIRIARTEVIASASESQEKFVEELWDVEEDGPMYKRWHATRGSRTRDAHRKIDGAIVPKDHTFKVGKDDMKYPGDRSASPGNLCNCRCSIAYLPEELVPERLRNSDQEAR